MIKIKDILSLIFSVLGIILVLFLTYYCTKWLSTKSNLVLKSKYIKIVDKIMLSQNKFLAIAEVNYKYYLLSITEKDIKILNEIENFILEQDDEKTEKNIEFNRILEKFIKTKQ